ncbi:MAG TPA: glycosyltransferase family 4 protein [Blastococcus sp.]|nr:glycosyltransferase family 4 protein [Blastococcus sp.]
MRILMVSPYPPKRDGIATYAAQAVAALQAEGHEVEVLSPEPSAAHYHLDFHAGARFGLALARRVAGYDKVVLQWHPAFFYRSSDPRHRIAVDAALTVAFRRARQVEIWVHEFEYEDATGNGPRAQACRALFRSADGLFFHSETERTRFLETVPVDRGKTHLAEHGASFVRRSDAGREEARASLGIPASSTVFLCIGFIQEHKGFDRAVRAFAGLAAHDCRLDVVGSTRLDEPDFVAYLNQLDRLCAETPGAHLHEGFVSDELFDRWIIASDVVVLPYRHIWSSGVLERAALYERPVIATRVGGLAEQAGNRSVTLVDDDAGLAVAMRRAAGVEHVEEPFELGNGDLFASVQAAVRERASRARGSDLPPPPSPGRARKETVPGAVASAVRRLPPYAMPPATSLRPGVSQVKGLIRRLIGWEVAPVVHHLHLLQQAVAASLDVLEERVAALEAAAAGAGTAEGPAGGGAAEADGSVAAGDPSPAPVPAPVPTH